MLLILTFKTHKKEIISFHSHFFCNILAYDVNSVRGVFFFSFFFFSRKSVFFSHPIFPTRCQIDACIFFRFSQSTRRLYIYIVSRARIPTVLHSLPCCRVCSCLIPFLFFFSPLPSPFSCENADKRRKINSFPFISE